MPLRKPGMVRVLLRSRQAFSKAAVVAGGGAVRVMDIEEFGSLVMALLLCKEVDVKKGVDEE